MSGLVLAAVVVLAVTCMVVLLVMRAQLYNRDHGTVPMVAWLVADNTKLRAALRGAGIAVDDDDEDVASGRHAAKGARCDPLDRVRERAAGPPLQNAATKPLTGSTEGRRGK